ncbi:MAG: protein translocase subunit SecF [Deltaproteobacteria bacterium]|nr:protein translocase subunit SecF [Deltaproteobacteria bacterium]
MAEPRTKKSPRAGAADTEKVASPAARQDLNFRTILPRNLSIDFVGKRHIFVILSTILNLLAIALFFIRPLNYGVDFTGGTSIRVRFAEPTTASAVRDDLDNLDLRDLTVQDFGDQGREFLLRFEIKEGEEMNSVSQTLSTLFNDKRGEGKFEILSVESVGPKVGADLRRQGFLAVLVATVFMGIYIALRFEFSFGLGAVIALVHDVLITVGALMLTQYAFDLTTLAALLTVIGFSVHDTIIISDRVRENLRRNPKADLAAVINQSINETLSRTLLTTGTALFVLIALFFLGGMGLQPFAFTLLIGLITGTYSTIYIAAPVVLLWSKSSRLAKS